MGLFLVTCTGTRAWTPASGPRTFLSARGTNSRVSKSISRPSHVGKLAFRAVFPGRLRTPGHTRCLAPRVSQTKWVPGATAATGPALNPHTASQLLRAPLTHTAPPRPPPGHSAPLAPRSTVSRPQAYHQVLALCRIPLPAAPPLYDRAPFPSHTSPVGNPACSICYSRPHAYSPQPACHTSSSTATSPIPHLPSFITASEGPVMEGSGHSLAPQLFSGQVSCLYCFLCLEAHLSLSAWWTPIHPPRSRTGVTFCDSFPLRGEFIVLDLSFCYNFHYACLFWHIFVYVCSRLWALQGQGLRFIHLYSYFRLSTDLGLSVCEMNWILTSLIYFREVANFEWNFFFKF